MSSFGFPDLSIFSRQQDSAVVVPVMHAYFSCPLLLRFSHLLHLKNVTLLFLYASVIMPRGWCSRVIMTRNATRIFSCIFFRFFIDLKNSFAYVLDKYDVHHFCFVSILLSMSTFLGHRPSIYRNSQESDILLQVHKIPIFVLGYRFLSNRSKYYVNFCYFKRSNG